VSSITAFCVGICRSGRRLGGVKLSWGYFGSGGGGGGGVVNIPIVDDTSGTV